MCYDRHHYVSLYECCMTNNWIKNYKSLVSMTKVKYTRSRYCNNKTTNMGLWLKNKLIGTARALFDCSGNWIGSSITMKVNGAKGGNLIRIIRTLSKKIYNKTPKK